MSKALKITVLGSGDSAGVPRIGGDWGNCDPNDIRNRRTRPSIMVQSDTTTLVIDTGPDFGLQLTRENVKKVDAILYTHDHSDHIMGMDDLRILQGRIGKKIPIYLDKLTYDALLEKFNYLFVETSKFYPAAVEPHIYSESDFEQSQRIGDIDFTIFKQDHGQGKISLGYRFGDIGYSTDMRDLPQTAIQALKGIEIWIADCADYNVGTGTLHADLAKVLELNKQIGGKKVYLTHLKMFYDYKTISAELPDGYALAYDGLTLNTRL